VAIAIVIPAYNEAATIAGVARAACAVASPVIVVDDGSTDGTLRCLDGLPVTPLRNGVNRGKGASLWRGLQHAVGEGAAAVITLDGDGQHPADAIPRLIEAYRAHPDRVIIAARLLARERMPPNRRFGNEVADFWISWAAGWPVRDSQSGFRLYPAALITRLRLNPGRARGFVFESEILIEAARLGFRPLAVPIAAIYREDARPSYYRPWRDTLSIIAMVAGKLLAWGMYPSGLFRSKRLAPDVYEAT
jgi:glycosyltransferase involved in cell wall biosynthesis